MNGSLTQWLPPPDPSGPVTCAACGCRLTETYLGDRRAWRHFASLHPDQDARGCRPHCLTVAHGRNGRALDPDGLAPAAVVAFLVADGVDETIAAEEGAAA
jgi:transcription initiation factor TFIIIB Brf1 subunit/transcription initiation factor TFIIB